MQLETCHLFKNPTLEEIIDSDKKARQFVIDQWKKGAVS